VAVAPAHRRRATQAQAVAHLRVQVPRQAVRRK
jgi:hypothetical protein